MQLRKTTTLKTLYLNILTPGLASLKKALSLVRTENGSEAVRQDEFCMNAEADFSV